MDVEITRFVAFLQFAVVIKKRGEKTVIHLKIIQCGANKDVNIFRNWNDEMS